MSIHPLRFVALALVVTSACARHPDLQHWKERRGREPSRAAAIRLLRDIPLAFCPEAIATTDAGFLLRAGTRASILGTQGEPIDPAASWEPPDPVPVPEGARRLEGLADAEAVGAWDGRVYLLDRPASALHAVRTPKAKLLWTVRAGAAIQVPPQVYLGRIIVQSFDNYVYCLRADNGHEMWRARMSHRLTHPAAFWRDRLLIAPEATPSLHLLDLNDGSPAATFEIEGEDERIVAGPAVIGDRGAVAHAPWGSGSCSLALLALSLDPS